VRPARKCRRTWRPSSDCSKKASDKYGHDEWATNLTDALEISTEAAVSSPSA
jgi:hypothetical protein